jgi:L,D-peptidoglycan transpeptidase YkuD (ErfK/YbiS/YcfS/YnhG family)
VPRRLHLLGLALALALVLPLSGAPASAAEPRTITLDGVAVRGWTPDVRQVVTVNRTSGTHARITFWARSEGRWVQRAQSRRARIGYGGLVRPRERVQGTGTTPVGTYRIPFTFGTGARRDRWTAPYRRIRDHHYWVQDNQSDYYNRWRSRLRGGFRWWLAPSHDDSSERLADYPRQYEMAAVVAYNYWRPVRHRGAGIFLHVNGSGATAGCVSAPRWFMVGVMNRLTARHNPRIAIGW